MTDSVDEWDWNNVVQKRKTTLGTRISPSLLVGQYFKLDKNEDIKSIGSSCRAEIGTYFYLDNCQHLSMGEKRGFVREIWNSCLGITELVERQQKRAEKFADLLHFSHFESEEDVDAGTMKCALKMWGEELRICENRARLWASCSYALFLKVRK